MERVVELPAGADEWTVAAWLVVEGEAVSRGEPIATVEIEGEGATTDAGDGGATADAEDGGATADAGDGGIAADVEAPANGVLERRYLEVGDAGPPGSPLGAVATAGPILPERDVTASAGPDLSGIAAVGGVSWPFDVTAEFGGGRAPTPVDHLLGALAACLADSVGVQADIREVAFDGIDVRAVGSPADGPLEAVTLEVTIGVGPGVDDATVERIVAGGERSCHVAASLREDLEVEVSWRRE